MAVHAALPANQASSSRQAPAAAVALLSAAVMASAAFLGGPVAPAAADEEQAVIEGPFKGYSGEHIVHFRSLVGWPWLAKVVVRTIS